MPWVDSSAPAVRLMRVPEGKLARANKHVRWPGVGKERDMAGSETHDLTSRFYGDADNDMVARCRTACLKEYWTRDSNDSTGISLASVSGFNNGSQLQTRQLYHRGGRCMSGSTGQWTSME
jgi:hypothetical protein